MRQVVQSIVIDANPPVGYRGALWIKYKKEDNSYELMLPVGGAWVSAGPSNEFINSIIDKLIHPDGEAPGSYNNDFDESFEIIAKAKPVFELAANKSVVVSSDSTDEQYPTAKAVYDALQDAGGCECTKKVQVEAGSTPIILEPNVITEIINDVNNISLEIDVPTNPRALFDTEYHYFVRFYVGDLGGFIIWPEDLAWQNEEYPELDSNTVYEISFVLTPSGNLLGMWAAFPNFEINPLIESL